jgi:hypothetical protein
MFRISPFFIFVALIIARVLIPVILRRVQGLSKRAAPRQQQQPTEEAEDQFNDDNVIRLPPVVAASEIIPPEAAVLEAGPSIEVSSFDDSHHLEIDTAQQIDENSAQPGREREERRQNAASGAALTTRLERYSPLKRAIILSELLGKPKCFDS